MSLEKFKFLFSNDGFYCSSFLQLSKKLDPYEGKLFIDTFKKEFQVFIDAMNRFHEIDNFDPEKKKKALELKPKIELMIALLFELWHSFFLSTFSTSFTYDYSENYALWKIYPTNVEGKLSIEQGIALRIDEEHFMKLVNCAKLYLEATPAVHMLPELVDINYISESKYKKLCNTKITYETGKKLLKTATLTKTEHYQYEKEKRILINLYDKNTKEIQGGYLKLDIKELFLNEDMCTIFISPFAASAIKNEVKAILTKNALSNEFIKDSKIKVPK